MNFQEWLIKEEKFADSYHEQAKATEKSSRFEIENTMERKYWEGYADAMTNALNEFTGAGTATLDDPNTEIQNLEKQARQFVIALKAGKFFDARAIALSMHYGADLEWRKN